jgi:hypothetical protein
MILKPDDILQKGDIVHFDINDTMVIDGLAGEAVWTLFSVEDSLAYVERPGPDLAEQVRILRERLDELCVSEEHYRYMHDHFGEGALETGRAWDNMRHSGDRSRAALAATKGDSHE